MAGSHGASERAFTEAAQTTAALLARAQEQVATADAALRALQAAFAEAARQSAAENDPSSARDSIWAADWVCTGPWPCSEATGVQAPLHNPVRCGDHKVVMAPKPGTTLYRIVGYQPIPADSTAGRG